MRRTPPDALDTGTYRRAASRRWRGDRPLGLERIVRNRRTLNHISKQLQRFRQSRPRNRKRPTEAVTARARRNRPAEHLGVFGDLRGGSGRGALEHRARREERETSLVVFFFNGTTDNEHPNARHWSANLPSDENGNAFGRAKNRDAGLFFFEFGWFCLCRGSGGAWRHRGQAL